MINNRWRGSLRDVKAKRGADVDSDHTLIIAKIKLKHRAVKKKNLREPPLDVSKLKDSGIKKAYQIEVTNRFSILQSEQELDIGQFNEALIKSGKKTMMPRKKKKEEWISDATWDKISERKEKKNKILATKSQRFKIQLQNPYSALDE